MSLTEQFPNSPSPQINFLGYQIIDLKKLETINHLKQLSGKDSNLQIITLNIEHLETAKTNPQFHRLLKEVDILIPDGESVALLASLLNLKITKYAGIDLCEKLIESHQRICCLGAEDLVIKSLEEKFKQKFKEKEFYFQHGYYNVENEVEVLERVSAFKPDLFIVALGVPRQDLLIAKYRHLFNNCICIGVGGALDVLAGKLKRAPKILIKLKLEWLYRIIQEPSRIFKFTRNITHFIEIALSLLFSKDKKTSQ